MALPTVAAGAEVLPAVASGGRVVAKAMPGAMDAIKKFAPSAWSKLTGIMKKDPAAIARTIANEGNGLAAQGLMFNAVRAGVPLEFINASVPHLSDNDVAILRRHAEQYVLSARQAVDAKQIDVPMENGDLLPPPGPVVKMIESVCRTLNIGSSELGDLITAFEVVKNSQISQYQAYNKFIGVKHL